MSTLCQVGVCQQFCVYMMVQTQENHSAVPKGEVPGGENGEVLFPLLSMNTSFLLNLLQRNGMESHFSSYQEK